MQTAVFVSSCHLTAKGRSGNGSRFSTQGSQRRSDSARRRSDPKKKHPARGFAERDPFMPGSGPQVARSPTAAAAPRRSGCPTVTDAEDASPLALLRCTQVILYPRS
jgi:hypothetical protein